MRKLILALLGASALVSVANAADLPSSMAAPVVAPVPVSAFTWTGLYFGLNAGYGWSTNSTNTVIAAPGALFTDPGSDGFVGGGQIGYNWQVSPGSGLLFGVEADIQYADLANRNLVGGPVAPGTVIGASPDIDWFGTVRGRIGFGFDRLMVYGTGGFAYGGGGRTSFPGVSNDTRTGWAAGGGVEWALPTSSFLNFFNSSAVTFKVEGLYVNLGSRGIPGIPLPDDEFAVVRAGVNYKFWASAQS